MKRVQQTLKPDSRHNLQYEEGEFEQYCARVSASKRRYLAARQAEAEADPVHELKQAEVRAFRAMMRNRNAESEAAYKTAWQALHDYRMKHDTGYRRTVEHDRRRAQETHAEVLQARFGVATTGMAAAASM